MIVTKDNVYTIVDAMEFLDISKRTIQRLCKKHKIKKIDNAYVINGATLLEWRDIRQKKSEKTRLRATSNDNLAPPRATSSFSKALQEIQQAKKTVEQLTEENAQRIKEQEAQLKKAINLVNKAAAEKELIYRTFTHEEYAEVLAKMDRVEQQEEQIQYLRQRIEKQDEALMNLQRSIEQRNYIEAKKLNKDD